MSVERVRWPPGLRRAARLVPLALSLLPSCQLSDDVVVRPIAPSASGGAAGSGGQSAGTGGSVDACDANRPTILAGVNASGELARCAGWAARRSFAHALCSCGTLDVRDVLATDSIDSSRPGEESPSQGAAVGINGSYSGGDYVRVGGSLTIADTGRLASAGGIDVAGDLRLRGTASAAGPIFVARDAWLLDEVSTLSLATVGRDLHLGAEGALSALGVAAVGGETLNEAFEIAPPCECEQGQLLDIDAIANDVVARNDNARIGLELDALTRVASPTSVTLTCGRFALRGISGDAPLSLRVSGRVVLAVSGDVALPPGFSLTLDDHAELDWFISGNLALDALASIGTLERPSAVRVYVLGAAAIDLPGTPLVSMNLYAPHSDVTVGLAGDVFGALFARNVAASSTLFVHYDRAVLRAEDGCDSAPPSSCSSCDVCGAAQTCTAGTCSRCTSDADCCFPLVCDDGTCQPLGR